MMKGPYDKVCHKCGKRFLARTHNQKNCSASCALYQKRTIEKSCDNCGELFEGRKTKKVCSKIECVTSLPQRNGFSWRLRKFGLTAEAYEQMLVEQDGVCRICNEPELTSRMGTRNRLSIDHCHTTSQVRGLLCGRCNQALGLFREDELIMNRAIEYLRNFKVRAVKVDPWME